MCRSDSRRKKEPVADRWVPGCSEEKGGEGARARSAWALVRVLAGLRVGLGRVWGQAGREGLAAAWEASFLFFFYFQFLFCFLFPIEFCVQNKFS